MWFSMLDSLATTTNTQYFAATLEVQEAIDTLGIGELRRYLLRLLEHSGVFSGLRVQGLTVDKFGLCGLGLGSTPGPKK